MISTGSGNELKSKLVAGINKLNAAVSSTLGPGGRNVIIRGNDGQIKITKDGVTVAKAFEQLEDSLEDIGAQMVKQVSIKSGDKAGDGTTTSTLLAATMINEGIKLITPGSNVVEIKRGIDKAVKAVVERLKEISEDIKEDQILQVASLSANNDQEVGQLISQALKNVGPDGVVAIETSKSGETTLETVEGMLLDRGFKSPYFVTDNNTMNAVLEEPYVFIYDDRLVTDKHVINLLQATLSDNKALLIVAADIDATALAILVTNKVRAGLKVCAIKAPDFGDRKTAILEDLASLTGATVISPAKGNNLEKMSQVELKEAFGKCRMSTITSNDTTIVDGKGDIANIEKRILEIKTQYDNAKSNFEKENLQQRISKLTGGVAIINVGGMSEVEMLEKKDRIDDALHATKAAIEQGIVPGAGMALVRSLSALDDMLLDNEDQYLGVRIVEKTLWMPFVKILSNAGISDAQSIYDKIKGIKRTKINILGIFKTEWSSNDKNIVDSIWNGYNVKTEEFGNLKEMGVIDPTKVTRTAIENAASVAGTFLTTENVVYTLPEAKKEETDYSQYM